MLFTVKFAHNHQKFKLVSQLNADDVHPETSVTNMLGAVLGAQQAKFTLEVMLLKAISYTEQKTSR